MGNDKEIEVNGKVIGENTKISLSVKTALWLIGGVIALFSAIFTVAYFDVKADVEDYKKHLEQSNKAFIKEVEESINVKLDKQRDRDDKFIEDIAKIRGDVQLLLDRTQRVNANINNGTPTMNENNPTNNVPTREH
jgi:hypothetical protein